MIASLACTLSLFVASAQAQGMPASILRLKPNATVRLETTTVGRIEGQFLRASGDTLFLAVQDSELVVPISATQSLSERGRASRTGAITGGIIGASGMTLMGIVLGAIAESEGDSSTGGIVVGAAVVGAAGGALVGGLIGAAIPKWHHRYP